MGVKASKEKILEVTIDMLVRLPMEEVTVREIARIAGVNLAAIHYYFSSKEILFNAAIEKIIFKSVDEWVAINTNTKTPGRNDLINLLMFLHLGCLDHREFAKTRIRNMLNFEQVNTANQKVYDTIFKLAKNLSLEKNTKKLKIKVSLLYSSLASISGSPEDIGAFTGLTLNKKEALRQYIKEIVEIIFPDEVNI